MWRREWNAASPAATASRATSGRQDLKASQRLRRCASAVAAFRDHYTELISLMEVGRKPGTMTMTQMLAKPGHEQAASALMPKVARAAGKASVAAHGTSKGIAITQFGQTRTVDPIEGWQYSIDMPDHLPARVVLDCCEGIIGGLEAKAVEAEQVEGTLAGKIASFVGFPARVRSAVELEHPSMGKVAFGVGVLGQIVIATTATAGALASWRA